MRALIRSIRSYVDNYRNRRTVDHFSVAMEALWAGPSN